MAVTDDGAHEGSIGKMDSCDQNDAIGTASRILSGMRSMGTKLC